MDENKSYREEIEIDPDNLDIECLRQPALFLKYSELLADAEKNYDRAKRNYNMEVAKASSKIRGNPDLYSNGGKLTESWISSLIESDEEVIKQDKVVAQCRHQVKVMTAVVAAFEQRKRSLNNLVALFGQQYFSGPDTIRPLNREFIKTQTSSIAKEKIRAKLSGKRIKDEED